MNRWNLASLFSTLAICLLICCVVGVLCMLVGSTGTHWPANVEFTYRAEAVFDAAIIGAALGAAGVAYQAILQNPLADPYLLGVSSGASLAAYLWRLPVFAAAIGAMHVAAFAISQQAFAFVGALAAVFVVLGLAGRRGRLQPVTLLLVGVIVNAVNGSIYLLLNAVVRDLAGTSGQLMFLVGGIQVILPAQRIAAVSVIGAGIIILWIISGRLNVAGLDDRQAESMGVRIHRLRWTTLIIASLMTAAAVAISGPIGFVGLVCPHLGRLLVGPDQRKLFPVATALGAALLMLADALSRYLAADNRLGTGLQVGVLTGLLGGPFFLMLLWRSRRVA
jgi:iron complex transport system permease protein